MKIERVVHPAHDLEIPNLLYVVQGSRLSVEGIGT